MTMRVIVMVRSENVLTPEEEAAWLAMSEEDQAASIAYSENVLRDQMNGTFNDGPKIAEVKVVYREDKPRQVEERECFVCDNDPEYVDWCTACEGTGKVKE